MSDIGTREEVDRNYAAFRKLLPRLMAEVPGKFVLMHRQEVVEAFDTFPDAMRVGRSQFGRGRFSVQEVTERPITLGFHAYAHRQTAG